MDKKSTPLTPKEIYQTIKEKPYRDGEALILDYVKATCIRFYVWENEQISACPKLADGFAEQVVDDFFYRSTNTVMPIIKTSKIRHIMNKPTHGGPRKGAGRKPGKKAYKNTKPKPTKVMRIPKSKVAAVIKLIKGN
jgi:hypothetical protein